MTVTKKVTLHSHTSEGSPDSSWSALEAAGAYRSDGFVSAVTDHDVWSPVAHKDWRLPGVEHTIEAGPKLHVVQVGHDFRFLAHPSIPFPEDTRRQAEEFVRLNGLDGVEKYSRGIKQYEGSIDGVVELANDDAHNRFQMGLSYMEVEARSPRAPDVLQAIRRGDFVNRVEFDPLKYGVGRAIQAASLALDRQWAEPPAPDWPPQEDYL